MLELVGDLWVWHTLGHWVVVTTNIGWKKNGANPMGAGLARTAAEKYPALPGWYGQRCRRYGADTAVCHYEPGRLLLFPTKPLDQSKPWLSWQQDACLTLVERSAQQLVQLVNILRGRGLISMDVVVPMVGCANGGLERDQVSPILKHYLDDGFVLVEHS